MNAPKIWAQALNGVAFDLINPRVDMVDVETIAIALSRVPRFVGHTLGGIVSVAQHSVEGARAIMRDLDNKPAALAFLFHDAHEAYISDITFPVRQAIEYIINVRTGLFCAGEMFRGALADLTERIDTVIHEAAGIDWPLAPDVQAIVKEYDSRMCIAERNARMSPTPYPWGGKYSVEPVEGADLSCWPNDKAADQWLYEFARLSD